MLAVAIVVEIGDVRLALTSVLQIPYLDAVFCLVTLSTAVEALAGFSLFHCLVFIFGFVNFVAL